MSVLAQIEQWPVDNAVCCLIDGSGRVIDQYGDTERLYSLASVTKLLSTYAFLIALEEEAISLTDPAGPEGSTVHHLFSHTAGYDFDSEVVRFPVGTMRGYSNTGFEKLGAHLEQETGISVSDYANEAVFAPLGMTNTRIDGSCAKDGVSTAKDLSKFAAELLNPTLISRASMKTATTVQFPGLAGILPGYGRQNPNDWGLGFEIRSAKTPHWTGKNHPPEVFGHFGQSGSYMWVDPKSELTCVTLTDKPFGIWAINTWSDFNEKIHDSIKHPQARVC